MRVTRNREKKIVTGGEQVKIDKYFDKKKKDSNPIT